MSATTFTIPSLAKPAPDDRSGSLKAKSQTQPSTHTKRSSSLPKSQAANARTTNNGRGRRNARGRHLSPPPANGRKPDRANRLPSFLSEPYSPVYQTHTTIDESLTNAGDALLLANNPNRQSLSKKKSKKTVTIGGKSTIVELNVEERRQRFYRLLHELHVHAEEYDNNPSTIIFPPGLLSTVESGDFRTFLTEFNNLASQHSSLLSMVSAQPHLMLTLGSDGRLQSYNHNPEQFFGLSISTMKLHGYHQWFSDTGSGSGSTSMPMPTNPFLAFRDSKNASFLTSVALAYQSRQPVREEHCMFVGARERPVPMTLTVVPIFYSHVYDQNSSFESLAWFDDPVTNTHAHATDSDANATNTFSPEVQYRSRRTVSITEHAFTSEEEEELRQKSRSRERQIEARAARRAAKARELRGVTIIIEDKELFWRLNQSSKKLKEYERQQAENRRRSSHGQSLSSDGDSGSDYGGGTTHRTSRMPMQPKLDTNISSALALMSNLAKQEKSAHKRRLYSDIIHMLSSSKAQESVNDDVISQLEESKGVNADLRDWLIKQINPTGQSPENNSSKTGSDSAYANNGSDGGNELRSSSLSLNTTTELSASAVPSAVQSPARGGLTPSMGLSARASTTPGDSFNVNGTNSNASNGSGSISERPRHSSIRPSVLQSARDLHEDSNTNHLNGSPLLTTDSDDSVMPTALVRKPVDDAQFIDESPEVSLLPKKTPRASNNNSITLGNTQRRSSIAITGLVNASTATGTTNGSDGSRSNRTSVKKSMRKSLVGRASISNNGPVSPLSHRQSTVSGMGTTTPKSGRNKTFASTVAVSSNDTVTSTTTVMQVARNTAITATLPLMEAWRENRTVIERAPDARVLYIDHRVGHQPLQRPATASTETDATSVTHTNSDSGSKITANTVIDAMIVVKGLIFQQVGCQVPEVHHNAGADVNHQPLFWTDLWHKHNNIDGDVDSQSQSQDNNATSVVPSVARSKHRLMHPRLEFNEAQGSALARSLASISVWNEFNIFHLSSHSHGWPLTFAFTSIMTQLNLIGKWGIDAELCSNFIREIERGYFANPYHSSTHAADVLQHCYHTVTQTHLALSLNDFDLFLLFVAAALHDFGHPGVSNQYLTTTLSPLSLQYNDKNVLENYHIASAFLLMQMKPDCNILRYMDTNTFKKARKILIELVLATDLAAHFEILAIWKRKEALIDVNKDEDKLLVMQMILKSGDLGHPSRVRHLHLTWSELITEEFFQQGDRERAQGYPVNSMLDRYTCNIVQSQIGFINFLVMPIYDAFAGYIGNDMYQTLVKANLTMWERLNAESVVVQAEKENQEFQLRQLAAERQEIEDRKRREALALIDVKRREEEEFQAAIERAEQEEAEALAKSLREAREVEERARRAQEEATSMALPHLVAPIIDVRLQREHDDDWRDNLSLDSDEEEQESVEEDKERQRRRAAKEAVMAAEREEVAAERRKEKDVKRTNEREAKALRDAESAKQAERDAIKAEEGKELEWRHSQEREEIEIEARKRQRVESLHQKRKKRGSLTFTPTDADNDSERGDIIQLEPRISLSKERALLNRVNVDVEFQSLKFKRLSDSHALTSIDTDGDRWPARPSTSSSAVVDAGSDDQSQTSTRPSTAATDTLSVDTDDSSYSHADTDSDSGSDDGDAAYMMGEAIENGSLASPNAPVRVKSQSLLERERVSNQIKASIAADRQKVDAGKDKLSQVMEIVDPLVLEQQTRLERKVKRVLRRERLKAKARAESADTHSGDGSDGHTLSAMRAVSMLLMDKEWGITKPLAEEKLVFESYLNCIADVDDEALEQQWLAKQQHRHSTIGTPNIHAHTHAVNDGGSGSDRDSSTFTTTLGPLEAIHDEKVASDADADMYVPTRTNKDTDTGTQSKSHQRHDSARSAQPQPLPVVRQSSLSLRNEDGSSARGQKKSQRVRVQAPGEEIKEQIVDAYAPTLITDVSDSVTDFLSPTSSDFYDSVLASPSSWSHTSSVSPVLEEWDSDIEDNSDIHNHTKDDVSFAATYLKPVTLQEIDEEKQRKKDLKSAMKSQRKRVAMQGKYQESDAKMESQASRQRLYGTNTHTRNDGSKTISFPPLAAPMVRSTSTVIREVSDITPVSVPSIRGPRLSEGAEVLLSRALVPSKGPSKTSSRLSINTDTVTDAHTASLDWRDEDEVAMETVVRRVIPRTRQAELERYRKQMIAKIRANGK